MVKKEPENLGVLSARYENSAIVCFILLLVSRDTVYQPLGWDGGYEDKALGSKQYWIKYLGNTTTPDDWVRQQWNKRASELCGQAFRVLKMNRQTASSQAKDLTTLVNTPLNRNNPRVEGIIQCL